MIDSLPPEFVSLLFGHGLLHKVVHDLAIPGSVRFWGLILGRWFAR